MRRFWLACLFALACNDHGTGPERGDLRVVISGLPTGVLAAVTVAGPGLSQTLTFTTTLTSLEPGAYVVTAATVSSGGVTYTPAQATQSVTVTANNVATATVNYTAVTNDVRLRFETVATGLTSPVYVTSPPNDPRLFIVEQNGRVRVISNGTLLSQPFLDLTSRVRFGGEQGLLSIAFHPQYATNGFFFVNFTDSRGDTRVERFKVSSNPNVADPASSTLILTVAQPFANHNGGLVMFGPDGFLYIGMGDGGSGGDPQGNGQNRNTLLGKLLRIDVNGALPYTIPSSNPFINQSGTRPEIWALGLRNPWRFAFDGQENRLYIADVGQSAREEINIVGATQAGLNYGWVIMEGSACYNASSCNQSGLTLPQVEYTHADGCSITGGFVYRGSKLPELAGHYFYTDYCGGWLRSLRFENGAVTAMRQWDVPKLQSPTSFGEDASRELYVTVAGGTVFRLVQQ